MSTNNSKKHAITHVTAVYRSDSDLKFAGHPLRHFHLRSTVGLLGPTVVLFYFIAIWRVYLAPLDTSNPVVFGAPGATLVYYSWFIAGVIGLNLSTYGLAGVEAAMLMEPRWNVKDAMRLMIHANVTWSGPGGWMKTFKWIIQTQKPPGRLWFLLALPSMLVFIAWPLSGLCLETTSGFLHGTRGIGSTVVGFSYANFNERNVGDAYKGASITWRNALDSRIPGAGIVYTPRGFDRSQHPWLDKIPVVLPKDDGVSRIFLTAQAETPIEGSTWGLLLQYNCSIVNSLSELTLLKDRKTTSGLGLLNSTRDLGAYYLQGNTTRVSIQNQTDPFASLSANSLHVVAEIAQQVWPDLSAGRKYFSRNPNASYLTNTHCYYNKNDTESILGDYPGIEQERIFEVVLWQLLTNISYKGSASPIYDHTLDRNLTDLYGAYDYRDFMYGFKTNRTIPSQPMSAIGVQCRSSSSVGTADVDGVRSSYSNFVRTDTPINVQRARCAHRFGAETLTNMFPEVPIVSNPYQDDDWVNSLFTSSAAPPQFYAGWTDNPNSPDTSKGFLIRLQYLQANQLKQSMLRAFSAYAVQLMYNGGQGFTTREGSEVSVINPNATSFITGTVIKQGTMPAIYPLVLFALWALVSTSLCATYGFRKRWTEILDGHTLFRLGVDLDEEERRMIQKFSNVSEVETSFGLAEIPGLVGDAEPKSVVGRIGLVRTSAAVKEKLYR